MDLISIQIEWGRGAAERLGLDTRHWLDRASGADVRWPVERLIEQARRDLELYIELDEAVQEASFNGGRYRKDLAVAVRWNFTTWLKTAQDLERHAAGAEAGGVRLRGLGELRHDIRRVESMLTDDEEFFDPSRLTPLRDEALREHRAGNTTPLLP